jgi:hypothetical protein
MKTKARMTKSGREDLRKIDRIQGGQLNLNEDKEDRCKKYRAPECRVHGNGDEEAQLYKGQSRNTKFIKTRNTELPKKLTSNTRIQRSQSVWVLTLRFLELRNLLVLFSSSRCPVLAAFRGPRYVVNSCWCWTILNKTYFTICTLHMYNLKLDDHDLWQMSRFFLAFLG